MQESLNNPNDSNALLSSTSTNGGALLQLLQLCDPTLPIGGFSHSAGLETYVQQKIVHNKATAQAFISEMLSRNLHYTDAAILSLAYDAASIADLTAILLLDQECTAVKLPEEMRMASKKLGLRLLKIFQPLANHTLVNKYQQAVQLQKAEANYCVVYAICAQALAIAKQDALYGFYYNAAAGFVTNSVKLIPLGQQDGQAILFQLMPLLQQLSVGSMQPQQDLIGLCCSGFDIRSMQHEQLYSRLYMS